MKRLFGSVLILLASVVTAGAQGIRPLDAAAFEEAKKGGRSELTNAPMVLSLKVRPGPQRADYGELIDRGSKAPFFFSVISPFTTVMIMVEESKRKFIEPMFPTLEELNAAKVQVSVSPGSSMLTVDTIENVVIKRGDLVIRPLKAEVTPMVVQNNAGAKKDSAHGLFTFDYSAFEPGASITFVLIGKQGNFEWTLEPNEVTELK